MRQFLILAASLALFAQCAQTEEIRLLDLEPADAQQQIDNQDQTLRYAPKVESNVPAVRFLGNEPHNVLEDVYLAQQYHGQDGLGGYLYGYAVPDIAKTERKKAGGDLRGAYQYIAGNGQEIKVEYWDEGNGFHQIDNVPKVLPQQIDDTPEVKAAKDEHARLWQEQALRNSQPVQSPYNSEGKYAQGPLSDEGQKQTKQIVLDYQQTHPQQAYQPNQYQAQSQQQTQYQQYNQQKQVGQPNYQPQSTQQQNQYQPKPQNNQYQQQASQLNNQQQQKPQINQQQPNYQPQQSQISQQTYQQEQQKIQTNQQQSSQSNYQQQQQKPQINQQQAGQPNHQQQGNNPAQSNQKSISQQTQYQPQQTQQQPQYQPAQNQHQYPQLKALPTQQQKQFQSGGGNVQYQNDQYYQQTKNSANEENNDGSYNPSKEDGEDDGSYKASAEEEQGPPKGFFYKFDYPVGIIVSKEGGSVAKRDSNDLQNVYATNKAIYEGQLKGVNVPAGSSNNGYQVR